MMNDVLFPHWKKNEIIRPASFATSWFILTLLFIILMLTIISPVEAIRPSNITPSSGWYAGNDYTLMDNSTAVQAVNNGNGYFSVNFPTDTTLTSCNIFRQADAPTEYWSVATEYTESSSGIVAGKRNTSWRFTPTVNTNYLYTFPQAVTAKSFLIGNWWATGWAVANEISCTGYNASYSDFPPTVNSSYTNLTVNVKAIGTTTNIQYATVYKWNGDGSLSTGITNSNGNVTLNYLSTSTSTGSLDVYAVGYDYYTEDYELTDYQQFKQIYLTPTNVPNSTNYIKVNLLDATTSQYIPNVNLTVTDKNVSQSYSMISGTGAEFITLTGTTKTRPLYFNDYYNFEGSKTGYVTNNLTIRYTSAGMVADLYLTPSALPDSGLELWLDIIDGATGYTVGGAGYQIYDSQYLQWWNGTTVTGQVAITRTGTYKQYPILLNKNYTLCASGTGYSGGCIYTGAFNSPYSITGQGKQPYVISLTYNGNIPTGNFSLNVYTIGTNNLAISNVGVMVNGQGHTTNTAGVTQFILPAGTYQVTAGKDGYFSTSGVITGAAGDTKSLTLQLVSGATTPTPTPTVIPTLVGYNTSGFEEVACVHYPYPPDWNAWQVMKNNIACFGVTGKTAQNLMLALLIIMFCGLAGATKAKGIGFIGGGIIGAAICFGLGILPIWILVFIIIVCGLVLAGLIYGKK